jgi:hypothetical protein
MRTPADYITYYLNLGTVYSGCWKSTYIQMYSRQAARLTGCAYSSLTGQLFLDVYMPLHLPPDVE